MKRIQQIKVTLQQTQQAIERRGSTIVIVLALLGLLMFTGFVFFTFASQEQSTAQFFTEAAKGPSGSELIDDAVFEYGAMQILQGAPARAKNSSLWSPDGRARYSLLRSMMGDDVHPFSGTGVNVIIDGDTTSATFNLPVIDQDYDGSAAASLAAAEETTITGDEPDDNKDWIEFIDSPKARIPALLLNRAVPGSTQVVAGVDTTTGDVDPERRARDVPQIDVDYTYPDINNPWLAWIGDGYHIDTTTSPPTYRKFPMRIPSFVRPQYLKADTAGNPNPTEDDWYRDPRLVARNFRPHPDHAFIDPQTGQAVDDGSGKPVRRYLDASNALDSSVIAALPAGSGGFPFEPPQDTQGSTTKRGELGVFTGSVRLIQPNLGDPTTWYVEAYYDLDVDNDGDGKNDGIWVDLDFPVMERSDGAKFTALHSFTIVDLDSLFNLNIHGNIHGDVAYSYGDAAKPFGLDPGDDTAILTDDIRRSISRSHLGLSPAEVNPIWGLTRDVWSQLPLPPTNPGDFTQHIEHFGRTPGDAMILPGEAADAIREAANMEFFWLMTGRGQFNGSTLEDLFAGKWGETDRLYYALQNRPNQLAEFSQAGVTQLDDDNNLGEGDQFSGQRFMGQPLDYRGTGRWTSLTDPTVIERKTPIAGNPSQWLSYRGSNVLFTNNLTSYSIARYICGPDGQPGIAGTDDDGANGTDDIGELGTVGSDDLIDSPSYNQLYDDAMEVIVDTDATRRPVDEIFTAEHVPFLQMADADVDNANNVDQVDDRLRDLAPYNFDDPEVRKHFTTMSWGMRKFPFENQLGPDMRPGRARIDDDGNGTVDDVAELGAGDDGPRPWEFSADTDGADNIDNTTLAQTPDGLGDGDGRLEFPPQFGTALPFTSLDPFRPQLRRLLTVEPGESQEVFGQWPLSVNHVVDVERTTNQPQAAEDIVNYRRYMRSAPLKMRPLTEHPDARLDSTVRDVTSLPPTPENPLSASTFHLPPFPPREWTDPGSTTWSRFQVQEFWARRDRQQLARDIYVLLYTLGGAGNTADPNLDYTGSNAGFVLHTEADLRRMAQFAVNLVDQMDRDNVATLFEYDRDLGNGWNLDDDASTRDSNPPSGTDFSYPEDGGERGLVVGVEMQQIAFSEVLGIEAKKASTPGNNPITYQNDSNDYRFLYMELQNMTPLDVELATDKAALASDWHRGLWRIVREDSPQADGSEINFVTLLDNVMSRKNIREANGVNADFLQAGRAFTIATSDGNQPVHSDFWVRTSAMSTSFSLIVPNKASGSVQPADASYKPYSDVDLVFDGTGANPVVATNNDHSTSGDFLIGPSAPSDGSPITLRLQRRANLNLPLLDDDTTSTNPNRANPWIDVDRVTVTFRDFSSINSSSTLMDITNKVTGMTSEERAEPLLQASLQDVTAEQDTTGPGTGTFRFNTLGAETNSATTGNFTAWQPHFDRDFGTITDVLNVPLYPPHDLTQDLGNSRLPAQQQVRTPNNPSTIDHYDDQAYTAAAKFLVPDFPDSAATVEYDNRWHRLLSILEVPPRAHRSLGDTFLVSRVPGRINLNTMRDMEVLAGMIDDTRIANYNFSSNTSYLPDVPGAPTRDIWTEFISARDGRLGIDSDSDAFFNFFASAHIDTDSNTTLDAYFLFPGMPGANPFRSASFTGRRSGLEIQHNGQVVPSPPSVPEQPRRNATIDDTMFRESWVDAGDNRGVGVNPDSRGLFEIGTRAYHNGTVSPARPEANGAVRDQLLSKLIGNSTTVSNTFVIFTTVGFFEVDEDSATGAVRIGGEFDVNDDGVLDDKDRGRAVYVVDRSEVFNAYDGGSGTFDWERLIKHRVILSRPEVQ